MKAGASTKRIWPKATDETCNELPQRYFAFVYFSCLARIHSFLFDVVLDVPGEYVFLEVQLTRIR